MTLTTTGNIVRVIVEVSVQWRYVNPVVNYLVNLQVIKFIFILLPELNIMFCEICLHFTKILLMLNKITATLLHDGIREQKVKNALQVHTFT